MRRLTITVLLAAMGATGCARTTSDCKGTATVCGASCVELNSDNLNCGACGNACEAGKVCSSGVCSLSCAAGLVNCGGNCIDPLTSVTHCGASGGCVGSEAGTLCAAGQQCSGGSCSCPTARPNACSEGASAFCADLTTDVQNCGACDNKCDLGKVCSQGTCTVNCAAGLVNCGGSCVDPLTNTAHCGASATCTAGNAGVACPAGQQCEGGSCSCPMAKPNACGFGVNAFCTDLLTDPGNCGTCGTTCSSGTACSSGNCVTSCPAGEHACAGKCIDPTSDPNYCGADAACGGSVCGPGAACYQGACFSLCSAGLVACNGICIDPMTNNSFCGASGYCTGRAAGEICGFGRVCKLGGCAIFADFTTHVLTQSWSLGGYVGRMAVTPDGRFAYVAKYPGPDIAKIDLVSAATTSIGAGNSLHYDVALAPDGSRLFVGGKLAVVDTTTDTVLVVNNIDAYILAAHPAGGKLYATDNSGAVQVVSIPSYTVVKTISGVSAPGDVGIAFTPDGAWCFIATQSGNIYVVDAASDTLLTTLSPGGQLENIAMAPDGAHAYATASSGNLIELDVASKAVSRVVTIPKPVSEWAFGIVASSDGKRLYVNGYQSARIVALSTTTLRPFTWMDMPGEPLGAIGVTPNGAELIASEQTNGATRLFRIVPSPDRPPVLAAIPSTTVQVTKSLSFQVTATDPDGDPIALSAVGLPANAQFHDNGDGTGTFTFVPDVTQWIGSPYSVTFQAEDGTFFDYASASITVTP